MKLFLALFFSVLFCSIVTGFSLSMLIRAFREYPIRESKSEKMTYSKAKVIRARIEYIEGSEENRHEAQLQYVFLDDPNRIGYIVSRSSGIHSAQAAYEFLTRYIPLGTPVEFKSTENGGVEFWVPSKAAFSSSTDSLRFGDSKAYFASIPWLPVAKPQVLVGHKQGSFEINQWNRMETEPMGVAIGGLFASISAILLLVVIFGPPRRILHTGQWLCLVLEIVLVVGFLALRGGLAFIPRIGPQLKEAFQLNPSDIPKSTELFSKER